MRQHQLLLAPENAEAILLKGRGKKDDICCYIKNVAIRPKKNIEYLGITFDERRSSGSNIVNVCEKADVKVGMLTKLMPNVSDPSSSKREVCCEVVLFIVLSKCC